MSTELRSSGNGCMVHADARYIDIGNAREVPLHEMMNLIIIACDARESEAMRPTKAEDVGDYVFYNDVGSSASGSKRRRATMTVWEGAL